jgi:hypothetical protein
VIISVVIFVKFKMKGLSEPPSRAFILEVYSVSHRRAVVSLDPPYHVDRRYIEKFEVGSLFIEHQSIAKTVGGRVHSNFQRHEESREFLDD